ncbi:MAG: hypothetical protein ACYSWP_24125 [Planctomycetota bacterium]|jgi:hypothetical protein
MTDKIKRFQKNSPTILYFILLASFGIASSLITSGCNESANNGIDGLSATPASGQLAEAEEIIRLSLSDEEPVVQVNAIEIVAKTHSIKFMPQVRRMLKSSIVPVRFASCLDLSDLPRVWPWETLDTHWQRLTSSFYLTTKTKTSELPQHMPHTDLERIGFTRY